MTEKPRYPVNTEVQDFSKSNILFAQNRKILDVVGNSVVENAVVAPVAEAKENTIGAIETISNEYCHENILFKHVV